ncbi:DHH family phosphoesterase [Anaerolineales bacterium HSG6]|nr:DHH family phosphoesterase [Anaerolineales bacterium HSG6]
MAKNSNQIYVIGHINPDTDSIASAMGYAWLLQDSAETETVTAARAGHLNPQTTWIFNRLKLEPPLLLPDASPRFSSISHRFNTTTPDRPLREAWSIANRTGGVAPVINKNGKPYGLITVVSLFNFLSRAIGSHPRREETRMAELFDQPCSEACDTTVPQFLNSSRIKDMLPRILQEERTEFWVIDKHKSYVGICRQRDALHPPRLKLVLVDHNEAGQALGSLDEADLLEILDHHRLGNPTTNAPIKFTVDIVGSTSTLVSERIDEAGLSAPPQLAGLLMAGLISDTLLLTSPTTTERDHQAADRLSRWAFIGGSVLDGETFESFGNEILQAGADLSSREPDDIVSADFKLYEAGGFKFGVSQIEVTNYAQLEERLKTIKKALITLRDAKGLDFVLLMATNVVVGSSRIILTGDVPRLDVLPFPHLADGSLKAKGVVSRKKQLLPLVLGALEN